MQLKNIAALTLVFVVIYNFLFFRTQPGIGLALQYLLLHTFFYLTKNKQTKNLDFAISSSVVSVSFAFLFAFRSNEIVQFINMLGALLFSTSALVFYKHEDKFQLTLPNFLLIPLTAFLKILSSVAVLLGSKTEKTIESSSNQLTPAIIRGVLFSVFLSGILLLLLTQGDHVFGQIVGNFFSTIWERIIVSALVFVVLVTLGVTKVRDHLSLFSGELSLSFGKFHELTIILGSLISLFTVFILVQFRYLFSQVGETELRQIGINSATYSEYVRAGFAEILIAATIVMAVIVYVSRYAHKLVDKQKGLIQLLTSVLIIENGLILMSATKRLFLYADAHGLTRAREFGFVFLVWLAVILIILLIGILKETGKTLQTKMVIGATLVILLALNLVNLDSLIATKYRPTVNKEVDYVYVANLSSDAYEGWLPAAEEADRVFKELSSKTELTSDDYRKFILARLTIERLSNSHIQPLLKKYDSDSKWQSFNFSEYVAYQYIKDNKDQFAEVYRSFNDSKELDGKFSQAVKDQTRLDRTTEAPLTTN